MVENANIPPGNGDITEEIQATPAPTAFGDDGFKSAVDFLVKNMKIGFSTHRCDKHPRYINLRTQEMFDNLVDLYANVFVTQFHHYKSFMDLFSPPTGVPPHVFAARCYISTWFIDLYVSNRKAVLELSCTAFIERYQQELCGVPHEYDHYLTSLNASIRPTYIKHHIDNALYIPIIVDSLTVNDKNPFGINNFTLEDNLYYGLIQIMKDKYLWGFSQLSSDPMGRPCWLFDWHSEDCACSWFSPKDNYDSDDVTLAYILGTACTSNLGYCDVDEWQFFAEGIVPENPNPLDYERVYERGFYGSYEIRTMEIDTDFSLTQFLAAASFIISGEEAQGDDRVMPRFRLIDWVYYSRVLKMDNHSRTRAHRMICNTSE